MRSISPAALKWLRAAALDAESISTAWVVQRAPWMNRHSYQRSFSTSPSCRKSSETVEPHTHYEFFPKTLPAGPPPQGPFNIDPRALRNEFLKLQAQAHPDLHAPANKNKAQTLSARINEAYRTLLDPLHRAQYLLSLRGINVSEDETLKVEEPDLLMEVLEAREAIEEANSEEEIEALKHENDKRIEASVVVLENAFEQDNLDSATKEAVRLRYWVNIKQTLNDWEKGKPVVLQH